MRTTASICSCATTETAQLVRRRHPQTGAMLIGPQWNNAGAIVVSDDGTQIAFVDSVGEFGSSKVLRLLESHGADARRCLRRRRYCRVRALHRTDAERRWRRARLHHGARCCAQDVDSWADVYSYRPASGEFQLESVDAVGESGRRPRSAPQLSASGDVLTFRAVGGGWRTAPQITGDIDWLLKRMMGDAIFGERVRAALIVLAETLLPRGLRSRSERHRFQIEAALGEPACGEQRNRDRTAAQQHRPIQRMAAQQVRERHQ